MTARLRGTMPVWVIVLLVGMPLVATLAVIWPLLHAAWSDRATYSHGYLVFALSLWLAWREIRRDPQHAWRPSAAGLLALVALLLAAFAGRAADVALVTQLSVPAILFTTLWASAGWRVAKRTVVAFGFMAFAMPFWDVINDTLRDLTIIVVGSLTRASSIPALIEGNFIHIPSGTFEVAGGCSGLHFLIVGSALATLSAVLSDLSWRLRIMLIAMGIALSLVANWLRVFAIIVAGHATQMEHYLVTVDHYYFGWLVFVVVLSPLFFVTRYMAPEADSTDGRLRSFREVLASLPGQPGWRIPATGIVLVTGSALLLLATVRPDGGSMEPPAVPRSLKTLDYVAPWDDATRPGYVNADWAVTGRYRASGRVVSMFAAGIRVQEQGKEIVYYQNTPEGPGGQRVSDGLSYVQTSGGESLAYREIEVIGPQEEQRMVWYAYRVAGVRTTSEAAAKLYQTLGALRGRWNAEVFVLSAACERDCSQARELLGDVAPVAESAVLGAAADSD